MELTEEMLNSGTKALQEYLTRKAAAAIDAHKFDLAELPDLVRRLKHESQTGQVLITASYLEDRVKQLMMFQLTDVKTKGKADSVFGSNAPLSSFGNRLTMCYQLGWLSSEGLTSISCFRKIRNEFAHRAYHASYADADIKRLFQPLEQNLDMFIRKFAPTMDRENKTGQRDFADLSDDERKICGMALQVVYICVDLLVRPEATKLGISWVLLLTDATYRPETVKKMFENMIFAVWAILEDGTNTPVT